MGAILVYLLIFFVIGILVNNSRNNSRPLKIENITVNELTSYGINIDSILNSEIDKIGVDTSNRIFFEGHWRTANTSDGLRRYYKIENKIDLVKVLQVEFIQYDDTVSKVSSGSAISRAIVGGVIAGGVGALVGGSTAKSKTTSKVNKISFKFKINDMQNPYKEVVIVQNTNGLTGIEQEYAWKIFGQIELILESNKNIEIQNPIPVEQVPKRRNENRQRRIK